MKKLLPVLLAGIAATVAGCCASSESEKTTATAAEKLDPQKIVADMERVADWQLRQDYMQKRRVDWTIGAYYTGHMALAGVSPKADKYLADAVAVGEKQNWNLNPRKTKYHADDHTIGQTYIELAQHFKKPEYLQPTREQFDFIIANPLPGADDLTVAKREQTGGSIWTDKWAWCDTLYMAPPVLAKLAAATGDIRYLDYMDNRWKLTTEFLYDKEEHLFYRDSRYFDKREANGKKVFWGRGNGWVVAGLARVMEVMPANYPARPYYEKLFKEMMAKLVTLQDAAGAWHTSLYDPETFSQPEMSSTGFIGYAMAWGVNNGLLDRKTYWPATLKAWNEINRHVVTGGPDDGKLGSVQPQGADPRHIKETDSENYGAGAYLLFGAEMLKAAK